MIEPRCRLDRVTSISLGTRHDVVIASGGAVIEATALKLYVFYSFNQRLYRRGCRARPLRGVTLLHLSPAFAAPQEGGVGARSE